MSDIENIFYKSIINNVRQKNINYAMDEFEKSSITIQRKICINVNILKTRNNRTCRSLKPKIIGKCVKKLLTIVLQSNKKYIKK